MILQNQISPRKRIADRLRTSCSPCEGKRPTKIPRESACVVGPVPSPGAFFNGLIGRLSTVVSQLNRAKRLECVELPPSVAALLRRTGAPACESPDSSRQRRQAGRTP